MQIFLLFTSNTGKPGISLFSVAGPHLLKKGGVTGPLPEDEEDGVASCRNTDMGSDITLPLVKAEVMVVKPAQWC